GVAQLPTPGGQQGHHPAQQLAAVDTPKPGVAIGEVAADLPQPRSPQQGITERVDQDIAVGVGHHPPAMGQGGAANDNGIPRAKGVDVVTVTDAQAHSATPEVVRWRCCQWSMVSAMARSSRRVILILSRWPSTTRGL